MKLNDEEKGAFLDRLWGITEACYSGVELPSRVDFDRFVKVGDVFIQEGGPGRLIGYALVTGQGYISSPLLRSIAVLPECRKLGVGKILLEDVAEYYRAKDYRVILLHCKADNPAQTLYFRCGYRVTAVLRNYYRPEGHGLEMRKEL